MGRSENFPHLGILCCKTFIISRLQRGKKFPIGEADGEKGMEGEPFRANDKTLFNIVHKSAFHKQGVSKLKRGLYDSGDTKGAAAADFDGVSCLLAH
ncbi:hypothetical protein EI77_01602 [Prosthecobacter fusiformis]|uniref:Uncharacterized protein n=1 Tax=Prosthecobacter fusiformis TaxID=48464 RepID=A0A4R7S485_9BACT|nr:hypothetical protein EI77_01602 [Prosthecobacter fusiformis]